MEIRIRDKEHFEQLILKGHTQFRCIFPNGRGYNMRFDYSALEWLNSAMEDFDGWIREGISYVCLDGTAHELMTEEYGNTG